MYKGTRFFVKTGHEWVKNVMLDEKNGDLGVGKIPYGANSDSVRGELAVRGVRTGSSRQSEHTLSPISFVVRFIFRTFADKA